jgi:peptidoglycan hydrolase-like protein with peptidoglycan-binding domain
MIRDLYQGLTGEDVRNMQGMLNLHLANTISPPLNTDGIFGSKTDHRVRYFQQVNRTLAIDGIVGPNTRRAILDFRKAQSQVSGAPVGSDITQRGAGLVLAGSASRGAPQRRSATAPAAQLASFRGAPLFGQVVQQQTPPGNQPKTVSLVVQQGVQGSANPWFLSPMVLSSQVNLFIRNNGRKPFVISPGLQFAANQVGSPVGPWTGQAFVQFGAAEITDGTIDWFNPFVQVALQKNANQPLNLGLSIGDQVNWNLIKDQLSLFANGQVVTSVDLTTGLCSAPAAQIVLGVSFEFIFF